MDAVKLNTSPPPVAEQVSKQVELAKSTTQTQENSQKRSTAGLFITPVIQFDSETLAVIFRVRDGLSGEVKQEYPQESVVKGRQAVAEATAKQANIAEPRKVQDIAVPTVDANNNGGVQVSLVSTETETTQSNGGAAGVATSTAGVAKGLGNT
ncbi:MAG: hypothetical protein VX049_04375 [Pseudomonadota bacterium]|nr:hypothetical protein [Pseudomonadota bacterium]